MQSGVKYENDEMNPEEVQQNEIQIFLNVQPLRGWMTLVRFPPNFIGGKNENDEMNPEGVEPSTILPVFYQSFGCIDTGCFFCNRSMVSFSFC